MLKVENEKNYFIIIYYHESYEKILVGHCNKGRNTTKCVYYILLLIFSDKDDYS